MLGEGSDCPNTQPTQYPEYLVAFNDGSYKKIEAREWKHSQWIHFTKPDGTHVMVNPANVNYIEKRE